MMNFVSLSLMKELNIALIVKEGSKIVRMNKDKITLTKNTKFFKLTFTVQDNQLFSH